MHFYKLGYRECRELPATTFWMMSKNIDRIRAEAEMRQAAVLVGVQSAEGIKDLIKDLRKQMGSVHEVEERQEDATRLRKEGLKRLARLGDLRKHEYPR